MAFFRFLKKLTTSHRKGMTSVYDRRERLIQIFEDTQQFINENPVLAAKAATSKESTVFYPANVYPQLSAKGDRVGEVCVTKHKTFEAAMGLHKQHPSWRIAVLNFASATNPGGGVKHGSSAQEESLCRCSTLYPALNSKLLWDQYYSVNRAARNPLYTDALIYTPGVVICKTDDSYPKRMPERDWVEVDVITCAAPNLRRIPGNVYNPDDGESVTVDDKRLYDIHTSRARHILTVAASRGVDALVLGAFGCGAFQNDPAVVAEAYRDVLAEMMSYFELIEFAIFCRPHETANYDVFRATLK